MPQGFGYNPSGDNSKGGSSSYLENILLLDSTLSDMTFQTPIQQSCFERITPWMQEFFESSVITHGEETILLTRSGSAIAYTRVIPWGEEEAIILTRSCVVTNVEITQDLTLFLLRENDNLFFGRFAIDRENNVIFEHSLLGSTCDRENLKTSIIAVIRFADEYDDLIVERWGGERALDRWSGMLPWK